METENRKNPDREPEAGRKETYPDICVCCGRPVPEGRMICWVCEQETKKDGAECIRQ